MNCGNCGKSNDYDAKVCVQCGSTLALTEYFRPTGFVEKKNTPKAKTKEPWDQEILTAGYKKKKQPPKEVLKAPEAPKAGASSPKGKKGTTPSSKAAYRPRKTGNGKKVPYTPQKAKTSKKLSPYKPRKKGADARAYNRTTRKLSIAEKTLRKTEKKPSRKWIFPTVLVMVILFAAAAIFVGTMNAGTREDRFTQVAEDFVTAVVMNDETKAADCIHPKMYGAVRPMDYEDAKRCEAAAYSMEQIESEALERELSETYGITDPITELYRIGVGYTVYGEETYGTTMTMDVLVAQIAGGVYAVKTENVSEAP